ncbi:MAG: CheR family methyltransferase [Roseococcus sp.]
MPAGPASGEDWTGRQKAVLAALGALAGLAPSSVLTSRLKRAAPLMAACDPASAHPDDPAWAALLDAVTVQETRLYRHPAQAELAGALLPARLAQAREEGRPLRILSAGCATGEEAFTLAAQAMHAMADTPGTGLEVIGLDLCRPALASAAEGVIATGMGDPLGLVPAALRPWLAAADGTPRLHPALRRSLAFRRANLLDGFGEAPGHDVIFCRNVLIYLTDPARAQVTAALAAALRPGGILALGPTDRAPAGLLHQGEAIWVKPHG